MADKWFLVFGSMATLMPMNTDTEQRLRELQTVFLTLNAEINLSAFRTEDTCWNGNILDSLPFLDVLPTLGLSPALTLLDIGTGGGFPLLPLALQLPDAALTGMDATQKKLKAIQQMVDELGIKNVSLLTGRAEELGHKPTYREQFDVVTSRAVAELPVLLEFCSPFVKPTGYVVLWKSLQIDQELASAKNALKELMLHLIHTHQYELPGDFGKRQLLVFRKASKLPKKYPRGVGVPKKNPL
ncbi:MAG: rRNA methyltransferase GidB [Candidatus Peribacteria bacterium]|nr:rRNA methyltransferase GidB [Candidatus Peribacteria bacterium]